MCKMDIVISKAGILLCLIFGTASSSEYLSATGSRHHLPPIRLKKHSLNHTVRSYLLEERFKVQHLNPESYVFSTNKYATIMIRACEI